MIRPIRIPVLLFTLLITSYACIAQYQIRIATGNMKFDADVDAKSISIEKINSFEVGVDYSLSDYFYLESSMGYGEVSGVDRLAWGGKEIGGGLVEPVYEDYLEGRYVPHHKTKYGYLNLAAGFRVFFDDEKYYLKGSFGGGVSTINVNMNLLNHNGEIYTFPVSGRGGFSLTDGIWDDTFETNFEEAPSYISYGSLSAGAGVKISERDYLGIKGAFHYTQTDYLDGIAWKTALDSSNNQDFVIIYSLELSIGIGSR